MCGINYEEICGWWGVIETLVFFMQKLLIDIKEILSRECVMLRVFGRKMIVKLTIVVDYFSNVFQSNGITDASTVVGAVQPSVTESTNKGLV